MNVRAERKAATTRVGFRGPCRGRACPAPAPPCGGSGDGGARPGWLVLNREVTPVRQLRTVFVAVLVALSLAACSSSSDSGVTPLKTVPSTAPSSIASSITPSSTPVSVPAATTTTAAPTGDDGIIAVFLASENTFFDVARHYPVNPADPRLAKYEAGKQLDSDRQSLTVLSLKHEVDVGPYTILTAPAPWVEQRAGNAVIVAACSVDSIAVADGATGAILEPATNTRAVIHGRLDLMNGTWMVTEAGVEQGKTC